MGDRAGGGRRMAAGRLQGRSRRRWVITGAVTGLWLLMLIISGSLTGSLVLLVLALLFLGLMAVGLRSLGVSRDHPAVQALATRPWRDGREVLALALRHMSEVFIITPNGSRLAPSSVELCMNPADLDSLANLIDLELVNASAAEAYVAEITASGAQVRQDVPIEVAWSRTRPSRPGATACGRAGRTRSAPARRRLPAPAAPAPRQPAPPGPSPTPPLARATQPPPRPSPPTAAAAGSTRRRPRRWRPGPRATPRPAPRHDVRAAPNPLLRLLTGDLTAETRVSGACAGRGPAAELLLPADPTVSRVQPSSPRGRRVADHRRGPQRAGRQRDGPDRRAGGPRRGRHPVGTAARLAELAGPDPALTSVRAPGAVRISCSA